ncbi:flagellar biosynthesis protein FlhF [Hymenobacter latericus]|uniref:hypothetical protein n=1 Tax=Hymenobacter sp. YIM 151858-1 TaxID=2987688 RepID=UPI00222776E5|nr:hypothetical protein [Hymenobacter sp. YIM 151858-1]UYZ61274.1 hypothetical protein OIS50_20085 [Hymenobacter sp. YIM 151858-1]
MRSGILLLVVVLALVALAALLWWRFKGSGRPAAPAATATRNHHSLRTFHYAPAGDTPKAAVPAGSAAAGAALASLLPAEDLEAPAPDQLPAEIVPADDVANSPQAAPPEAPEDAPGPVTDEAQRPASIRHAAGAVAVLLDTVDEAPAAVPAASLPASDPDEEPAEALFHNPLTAPAPTANDQANRAAEIALRQQRRARMSADAAAQRAALNDLFPGAGSPVPTAKPS